MPPEPRPEPAAATLAWSSVQRLDLGGGEHLGRDAAGNDALQPEAAEHAAAILVDELREGIAVFDLVDARPLHVAGDRDQLRARALRRADLAEGRRRRRGRCR